MEIQQKQNKLVLLIVCLGLIAFFLCACTSTNSGNSEFEDKQKEMGEKIQKFVQILNDYKSKKIDEFALPAELGTVQGETMILVSEIEALVKMYPNNKQGQKLLEGCKLYSEGIRIYSSGLISKDSATMNTGSTKSIKGSKIIEKCEFE